MNVDNLVKMANEIAAFFASESPAERAPRDVATHLKRYWEPRMRHAMFEHYLRGGAGLTDLARAGVAILAAEAAAEPPKPAAAG
ncbi:MAG: formate dehydrogenase subunit delta [Steroidobacteraceae bacterium]